MLVILTAEYGKIRAVARSVRRTRSKLGGHLEPLAETHLDMVEGRGELWTVTGARLLAQREFSIEALAAAFRAAELTDQFLPDGQAAPEIYLALKGLLAQLSDGGDPDLLLLGFIFTLLNQAGLQPVLEQCVVCRQSLVEGSFSARGGGMSHPVCLSGEVGIQLSETEVRELRGLLVGRTITPSDESLRRLRLVETDLLNHALSRALKSDGFAKTVKQLSPGGIK